MIHASCLCGSVRLAYARAVPAVGMCHRSLRPKVSGAACWVPAGLLDDDPGPTVGGHIFVGSKASWDAIGGAAPQFNERPPRGE